VEGVRCIRKVDDEGCGDGVAWMSAVGAVTAKESGTGVKTKVDKGICVVLVLLEENRICENVL